MVSPYVKTVRLRSGCMPASMIFFKMGGGLDEDFHRNYNFSNTLKHLIFIRGPQVTATMAILFVPFGVIGTM